MQDGAELGTDQRTQRLPHAVGGDDTGDAEPVTELGRQDRLAHTGGPRHQHDHRSLGAPQRPEQRVAAGELLPRLLLQQAANDGPDPLAVDARHPQAPQLVLGTPRQAVRQLRVETDRQQRLREHAARERQPRGAARLDDHQLRRQGQRRLVAGPHVTAEARLQRRSDPLVQLALLHLPATVGPQAQLDLAHDGVGLLERQAELLERGRQLSPTERIAPAGLVDHLERTERWRLPLQGVGGLGSDLLGHPAPQTLHEFAQLDLVLVPLAVVLLDLTRQAHGVLGRDAGGLQHLDDGARGERVALRPVLHAQISSLHVRASSTKEASTTPPGRPPAPAGQGGP